MKNALVVIDYPYGTDITDEQKIYGKFLDQATEREREAKGVQRLDQNVWLIDVRTAQHFLAWLLAKAKALPLPRPVRVMYLDHEDWITV